MRIRRHLTGKLGLVSSGLVAMIVLAVPPSAWAAPTITEFTTGNGTTDIVAGPDGNLWFLETTANKIGRLTPGGTLTEYSSGLLSNAGLSGIAVGPDGNLWFAESNRDRIGYITTGVTPTIQDFPLTAGRAPQDIVAGQDGNLWFTESGANRIGRMTPAGAVTGEFVIAGSNRNPDAIAAGPDGNLWFTEQNAAGGIGKITTLGGIVEVALSSDVPWGITTGPDGNLWFTNSANNGEIDRITTAGTLLTRFTAGLTTNGFPLDITSGPDGNLYFTETAGSGRLGQITPSGTVTEFSSGLSHAPFGITAGPDGNIWFTEGSGNRVGRLTVAPAVATSPATPVHFADATLTGSVTPRAQATTYRFDWGLTAAYGTSTTTTPAGSGTSPVPVSAALIGLVPATTYHFRLVATNGAGTTFGVDRTFTTAAPPPAVTTEVASTTGESTATLNATVNPNGLATTYHFDFGSTEEYGDRSPPSDSPAGSGSLPLALSQALSGLNAGTTYHYRAVASNASGVTYGSDQSFTTTPLFVAPPSALAPTPASGLPPATPPVLGQSATIATVSGTVLVELPGRADYLSLDAASTVPVGTTIDASAGTMRLTNVRDTSGKLQTGTFWGGSFVVRQARGKRAPTVLTLTAPMSCVRQPASVIPKKGRVRQLWGRDNHGSFVTRGRSAVATVRGTTWFMRDTCAGTLVKVTKGTVSVRDLGKRRTIVVSAGHSYLARL